MAGHTSEKRWRRNQNSVFGNAGVSELVQQLCQNMIAALDASKTAFLEMQELFNFAGGTVQTLANQLFKEDWETRVSDPEGAPGVFDIQANAQELGKAQDLFDAVTALNDLHGAASNQVTTTEDRFAQLRRMS